MQRESMVLSESLRREVLLHRDRFEWQPASRELVDRVLDRLGLEPDSPEHRLRELLAAGLQSSEIRHLRGLDEPFAALCELETVLAACEELAAMFARGRAGEFSAVISRVAGGDDGDLLDVLTQSFKDVDSLIDHELMLREARGVMAAERLRMVSAAVGGAAGGRR